MKTKTTLPILSALYKCKKAFSTVMSTIILTAILLIILLIASFVATNVLAVQMNSAEFEQAKTNMVLLDSVIQDVALRQGAGGYVQFNQRTGGIGLTQSNSLNLKIDVTANGNLQHEIYDKTFDDVVHLIYSAGHQTPGTDMDLKGSSSIGSIANVNEPLGYLRVEQDQGTKIKLDHDRIRITPVGLIDSKTSLFEITFIHLVSGTTRGSGTVNVRVQNIGITTSNFNIDINNNALSTLHFDVTLGDAPIQTSQEYSLDEQTETVVFLITEIKIRVDIG